jgi:hypothetical protein
MGKQVHEGGQEGVCRSLKQSQVVGCQLENKEVGLIAVHRNPCHFLHDADTDILDHKKALKSTQGSHSLQNAEHVCQMHVKK